MYVYIQKRYFPFYPSGNTYFFRHSDKEEMDAWAMDITEFARKGRKMELSLVL